MDEPEKIYQDAYHAHYSLGDAAAAGDGYRRLLREFSESVQAGYARTQLANLQSHAVELERKRAALLSTEMESPSPRSVLVTTAPSIEGRSIVETIDVISVESVLGLNVFVDLLARMADIAGGRSATTENALREARQQCLYELRREALKLGGNAVVATSMHYTEFSGGGKSMLILAVTGTAVRLEEPNSAIGSEHQLDPT